MFSRDISSNRWITLVLMMVFMLFATPTPGLEVSAGESARTSMSHGMEFFTSNQATVRKHSSATEGLRLAGHISAFSFLLLAMKNAASRALPKARVSFRPQIARRLTRLLLSPIKFTSLFV